MLKRLIKYFRKSKETKQDVDPMSQIEKDIKINTPCGQPEYKLIFTFVAHAFVVAIRRDLLENNKGYRYSYPLLDVEDIKKRIRDASSYIEKKELESELRDYGAINIYGGIVDVDGRLSHNFGSSYSITDVDDIHGNSLSAYTEKLIILTLLRGIKEKPLANVFESFVIETDKHFYYYDKAKKRAVRANAVSNLPVYR